MNVIIIAAIALLVLVILVAIFSGRMGIWNKEVDDQTQGAECPNPTSASVGCDPDTERQAIGKFKNLEAGQICCEPK